jgi:hypothetical protein
MRIVIAGGHGKVALILERLLAEAGHEPVAIIRNPDHRADVDARGAAAVVLDLEAASVDEVAQVLKNADAAVFAAGAGPGSGAERKFTVDRDAAILLADAAEAAGVGRLVVISAMNADRFDPASDDVFQQYLRAKSEADASVRAATSTGPSCDPARSRTTRAPGSSAPPRRCRTGRFPERMSRPRSPPCSKRAPRAACSSISCRVMSRSGTRSAGWDDGGARD